MADIKSFNDYIEEHTPHLVHEAVCLKCLYRFIVCYQEKTLLKELECGNCGEVGYVIATGQIIEEGEE